MTSIEVQQSRKVRLKKFATEGAGRLIIFLIGAIVLWWVISAFLIERPDRYLPLPLDVLFSSADMLTKGSLLSFYSDTLTRLVIGGVVGIAIGIPVGLALGLNRTVADLSLIHI